MLFKMEIYNLQKWNISVTTAISKDAGDFQQTLLRSR